MMQTIQLERQGPVAWVWLNRPRQLNAMNQTLLAELHDTFGALEKDELVHAVVLAGRGQGFSAGFDLAWMAGQDAEAMAGGLPGIEAVYDVIEACRQPVVAALHGVVVGGGLLLALVADLRLAAEHARLSVPEVKIGIFPNLRLIPRLERAVGLSTAKRLVLCGEAVDAAEALRIGLVEQVVPAQALYAQAQSLAERLAALPPYAVQAAKEAFAAARRPDFVAWERARFAACWERPERQAAMQAFLAGQRG